MLILLLKWWYCLSITQKFWTRIKRFWCCEPILWKWWKRLF